MANNVFSDKQIEEFISLAVEVGISRAMRDLGYPGSWSTAKRWCDARNIEITVDSLKASAAAVREWYKDEEVIRVAEEGMNRVHEQLVEKELDADSMKKLSESYQKFANTWLLVKGKSTSINESRSVGEMDLEIMKIIEEENKRSNDLMDEVKHDA